MKKGFLKTALSVMLFGSVVALTACHESAHVSEGGSNPVVVAPQNTLTIAPVTMDGTPIAGATVAVLGQQWTPAADGNGGYTFGNVPNGTYVVVVNAPGYEAVQAEVEVSSDVNTGVAVFREVRLLSSNTVVAVTPAEVVATGGFDDSFQTESALPQSDESYGYSRVGVNVTAANIAATDPIAQKGLRFTPFYDEDYAENAMAAATGSRAPETSTELYCGVCVTYNDMTGLGTTLQTPVTVSFAVSDGIKDQIYVKKLNRVGQWVDANADKSQANSIVVTANELTFYALFFDVTENVLNDEPVTILQQEKFGPSSSYIHSFPYVYNTGSILNGRPQGESFPVAYLKNLITMRHGAIVTQAQPRTGAYTAVASLPAFAKLTVWGTQSKQRIVISALNATLFFDAWGNVTFRQELTTIDQHSGGVVED